MQQIFKVPVRDNSVIKAPLEVGKVYYVIQWHDSREMEELFTICKGERDTLQYPTLRGAKRAIEKYREVMGEYALYIAKVHRVMAE